MILIKIKRAVIRYTKKFRRVLGALFFKSRMSSWRECYQYLNTIHQDVKSSAIRKSKGDREEAYKYDVSIIMTTYNRASLVERCIKSILSNAPRNKKYRFEYIFVNDGSKDNTAAILEKYKNYPDVKVIHQENKGVSGARNTALDVAEGRYLFSVDDDDILLEGSIEKLLKISERGEYDIVEGAMIKISQDGTEKKVKQAHIGEVEHPLGTLKGFACGRLTSKKLYDRICFPEKYWFEDSINAALIYRDTIKAYITKDIVYKYYSTETSITSSVDSPKNIDSIYVTMQLLKDRKALGLPFKQENYEYLLKMVNLTYQRTRSLDTRARYCIFEINRHLFQEYYRGFRTEATNFLKQIEKSLLENNFKKYVMACEFHW